MGGTLSNPTNSDTPPTSVNLMALESRLLIIWMIRFSSPHKQEGMSGSQSMWNVRPFAFVFGSFSL